MIGRKGKGGFYLFDRKTRKKQAIDLATGEYRPRSSPTCRSWQRGPDAADDAPTKAGRYAWDVMGKTLAYAASVVPEAAGTLADVDAAMRLGYNWRFGPFELIDKLGTAGSRSGCAPRAARCRRCSTSRLGGRSTGWRAAASSS